MAFVGMRHVVFAPITEETNGKALVYGTGVLLGRAMTANIEFNRNEDGLYADDTLAESDNSITGGTIEIGVDDVQEDAQEAALGVKKVKVEDELEEPEVYEYRETGTPSPYGGVGYIRVRRYKGKTSYLAYWVYKTQFAMGSEDAETKGESINWQTPTVSGNIMGAYIDASGEPTFRTHRIFENAADAEKWLDKLANYTAAAAAMVRNGAPNKAVAVAPSVEAIKDAIAKADSEEGKA